jgi:SAM-dependent methyltransferase
MQYAELETISHRTSYQAPCTAATQEIVNTIRARLQSSNNLILPLEKTLELLDALTMFNLGRFLLHNQGLNGYWTSYVFRFPLGNQPSHSLEEWLLKKSLLTIARARFIKFQSLLQSELRSGIHMASIPCGLMDDLLLLNYDGLQNVKLTGIDIDQESIQFAGVNAKQNNLSSQTFFTQKNAWEIALNEEFDVITSNGLNMYESDSNKLIQLYKNFYLALKKGGKLIISFITPPPANFLTEECCQKIGVSVADLRQEISIFTDILQVKYLNFCTEEGMKKQLGAAGFGKVEIVYTREGIAPIAIAFK